MLVPLVEGAPLRREFGPDIPGFPRDDFIPTAPITKDEEANPESDDVAHRPLVLPWGEEADHLGSNAWAVTPSRTGGPTTLISNSHQPLRGGVAWYELGVQSGEGWHFTGANFPGSPYPFVGHNENLGWTNTVNRPDMVDVYKLTVNDAKTQYQLDGEWRDLGRVDRGLLGIVLV